MNKLINLRTIRLALIGLILLSASSMATAQVFRRVASEPFSGRITIEDKRKASPVPSYLRAQTINVAPLFEEGWRVARPLLTQMALDYLNERDVGGGIRTSRNQLHLAEKGYLYFGTDGSGITLRYSLPASVLQTSFRLPGPTPAGWDPTIAVACSAELSIELNKTGSGLGMSVSPARLNLFCNPPVGRNLTGELGIGVLGLIKTLGGPDFIADGLRQVNGRNDALSKKIDIELSKYMSGKTNRNTFIGVTRDNNMVDGSARKIIRALITIEDNVEIRVN